MLTNNEIRARAANFARQYKDTTYEKGESQSFYNDLFNVFGIERHDVAMFEVFVKDCNNESGYIDLFWPKVLIAEHKSAGEDMDGAIAQAQNYFMALDTSRRPRYLLSCDFQRFKLIDLHDRKQFNFDLHNLPDNIHLFGFMTGRKPVQTHSDPVSIKASEMMGKIYSELERVKYTTHDRTYLLTRLTFCLFADDTGIFDPPNIFYAYIKNRTNVDGSDLGKSLIEIFQNLDKPEFSRQTNLDDDIRQFPYINGGLFKSRIDIPHFDSKMRKLLLDACEFDWSKVSPAIFGSLFQSVMTSNEQHDTGAHYTTEDNILKVINPLFIDDLNKEFNNICGRKDKYKKNELIKFHNKLRSLIFLDPACGSGNFLIIAYRELRRLEHKIILQLHDRKKQLLNIEGLSKVNVDQFYGIELNEFSARIAETAIWMMDHIMNNELSEIFGIVYARIPLEKSPVIINGDSLEIDWNEIISNTKCTYVFGNPPFGGSKILSAFQREQVKKIANLKKNGGTLDYVTSWFIKAAKYVNENTPIAFVSTNSITQGEQVAQLWPILLDNHGLEIIFAYKSFKWGSEIRGKAHVIVVIIGLSKKPKQVKRLFEIKHNAIIEEQCEYITPYLIATQKPFPIVKESSKPINKLPRMIMGSQPIDGGHYIFTTDEKNEFLLKEPHAKSFIRPYVNAKDFLNNDHRWILALQNVDLQLLKKSPQTLKRINLVKKFRKKSMRATTRSLSNTPRYYCLNVIPEKSFLMIPSTSSENRKYVPIGYMQPPVIPSNANMIVENANVSLFGLLISNMHMIWLKTFGGKLKNDFRYSAGMVYNTFPVPDNYDSITLYAQKILDVREKYSNSTLATLYDPTIMPKDLLNSHKKLDRMVEKLYRTHPFTSDSERIEFLLKKYAEMLKNT